MSQRCYTKRDIEQAMERYHAQIAHAESVIRGLPLNEMGIYDVVHASTNFLIVSTIRQQMIDELVHTTLNDEITLCREQVLTRNPDLDSHVSLIDLFAGTPLEAQEHPFFFAVYNDPTYQYVLTQSTPAPQFRNDHMRYTPKNVPFYLVQDTDMGHITPLEVRLT